MKRYRVRWRPGARMDYEQAMQWVGSVLQLVQSICAMRCVND